MSMKFDDRPDYEADISIDPDELAGELLDQSCRYFRYSELYAQAVMDRDRAKENLAQVQAQLDSEVRSKPEDFGIQKITEAAIKAAILLDDRYSEANEKMLQANLVSLTLQGAVTAFDHRKRMLEKITDLKISGLYSDPTIRKEVNKLATDALSDAQNDALNARMDQKKSSGSPLRRVRREQ